MAVLVGPVATALIRWIEDGGAPVSIFGLLLFLVGPVIGKVGKTAELLVFNTNPKPWLGGRLKRRQRLILPFGTDTLLSRGFSAGMAGAMVLLTSTSAGWSALNIAGLGFVILGSGTVGFALSRLVVGLVIVHRSGLWGASQRAWVIGASLIALGTAGNATRACVAVLQLTPAL
jgi:hypothetical protein